MKRIVPFLLLAGCPTAGQPGPAAPSNMPPAEAGPVAVMVSFGDDVAIPIACYQPGKDITADPEVCAAMIGDPATAASLPGGRAQVSGRRKWDCAGLEGEGLGTKIEAASPAGSGPLGDVLIAPMARAEHVRAWQRGGTLDEDVAYQFDLVAERWFEQQEEEQQPPQPRLVGTVVADFDGDGQADTVYTVHPEGEVDEYGETAAGPGPRVLLARLSSRSPDVTLLLETDFEDPTAFAAFDLDGDGAAELFYDLPYYEGDSTSLATIADGQLRWIGGWGCGL